MFKKLLLTTTLAVFVTVFTAPIVIEDAGAKRFGGGSSFSRSSYRSSGFGGSKSGSKKLFGSYKSKKAAGNIEKSKPSSKKLTSSKKVTSAKFTGSKNKSDFKTVGSGKQTRAAKSALSKQRNRFKKSPAITNKTTANIRKTYAGNKTYTRAASYDRSTYYTRRNQYYGGYNTPSYVYGSSSSFGMWDTIFLYSMLSSMSHNNHASSFAYNHQNDADYRAWRREADRLAQDNAELRTQLAQMDAGAGKMKGKINPDFIPDGIDADIAMSQEVLASQKPTLRVCVGGNTGTYFRVTTGVLMPGINTVNIVPVLTAGSGEILEKVSNGACDAGFVQADSYWNFVESKKTDVLPFERVSSPYKEAVHLICNSDGPTSISDLSAANKVWFPAKSGAAETWTNFVGEDSGFGSIKTILNDSSMKVSSYEEAIMKASSDKKSCAMYVGAPGASKLVNNIDKGAKASNLVLVDINDRDLDDTTDPSGKMVYQSSEINVGRYKNLNRKGGCYGYCKGDIDSLFLNADFIVATKWKSANKETYPKLALDLLAAQSDIAFAANNN